MSSMTDEELRNALDEEIRARKRILDELKAKSEAQLIAIEELERRKRHMSDGIRKSAAEEEIETLREETAVSYTGAMDVEYGQFARQYNYISNLKKRFDHPFELIMISLDAEEGYDLSKEELEKEMAYMEHSIRQTLRNVDVMTKCGEQQFLIILLGSDLEGAKSAVDRIFRDYHEMSDKRVCVPTYMVVELKENETE